MGLPELEKLGAQQQSSKVRRASRDWGNSSNRGLAGPGISRHQARENYRVIQNVKDPTLLNGGSHRRSGVRRGQIGTDDCGHRGDKSTDHCSSSRSARGGS